LIGNALQAMWQTVVGMITEQRAVSRNACDSIRVNLESDSNVRDESDPHHEKHHEQRISIFRGSTID
jgi:hypothetical protein